jgi:site-specific recombinase XerD
MYSQSLARLTKEGEQCKSMAITTVSRRRSKRVTAARAAAQRAKIDGSKEGQHHTTALSTMTIDLAVQQYLDNLVGGNRSKKTIEWHQTALGLFQRFLVSECNILQVSQITATEVSSWLVSLCQTPTAKGKLRTAHTVETYARSARAFCNWLVFGEYLDRTPFAKVTFPKVGKPLIRLIEPEEFERLLLACRPSGEMGILVDRAAARNRAMLWVFLDTGICVSELCGLRLKDIDRRHAY